MPFDGFPSPTTYQTVALADGAAGNIQTLQSMATFVIRDAGSPFARNLALCIVNGISGHDEAAQVTALFNYAQKCIAYQMHPLTAQWVQDLERSASVYKSGDCTSKSVALATLLASLGYYSDFRVCNYSPGSSDFSHVFVIACLSDGTKIPLDPSSPDSAPGWQSDCANMSDYKYWQSAPLMGDEMDGDFGGDEGDWGAVIDDSTFFDPGGAGGGSGDIGADLQSIIDSLTAGYDNAPQDSQLWQDPNGGVAIFNADGSTSPYDPSNPLDQAAAIEYQLTNPSGQIAGTASNQINFPDGSVEVQNVDGSIVKINADNSYTLWNTNGNIQSFDRNGNPLSPPVQTGKTPPTISSGAGGGSGGGVPLGGGSAQKAPTTATTQPTTTQTLTSILKGVTDALGLTQPTSTLRPTTAINPATGLPVLINPITGLPISAAASNQGISLTSQGLSLGGSGTISLTTIAILVAVFFALKK